MSDSKSPLMFDDIYEDVRLALLHYSGIIDQLQILGESEITQNEVDEARDVIRQAEEDKTSLKNDIMQLEKQSKKVDQRSKTKKLRDLYQKENGRLEFLQKEITQNCKEDIREQIRTKDKKSSIIKGQQKMQELGNIPLQQSKQSQNNSKQQQQSQQQQQEQQEQREQHIEIDHLEMRNSIIKENQQDIDVIHMKTHQIQRIVQDLALEVDNQDKELIRIDGDFTKTLENVKGAGEQLIQTQTTQKSSSKKHICLLICALVALGVLLMIILI